MEQVLKYDYCTGCGACLSVCPKKAIKPQDDTEGFEMPVIDQSLCVDCGLCKKVCPVIHFDEIKDKVIEGNTQQIAFAARNKNYEQRLISSSGGIFPVIAEYVLNKGGFVVGAAFDEKFNVVQKIISSDKELIQLQGSKYAQSKLDDTFKIISEIIKGGYLVLYSGMTCQIYGLKSYLKKEYNNLITIDLICLGIPSPGAWKKYLNSFFKGEQIEHINFKDKTIGWNKFCVSIKTNKRSFLEVGKQNYYMMNMFNTYTIRKSCFNCKFKNKERPSDFTIADCWGTSRLAEEINDNKGLSSVLIHTQKGREIWKEIDKSFDLKEVPYDDVCVKNYNMTKVYSNNKQRFIFYYLLNKVSVKFAYKFMSKKHRIIEKLIDIL